MEAWGSRMPRFWEVVVDGVEKRRKVSVGGLTCYYFLFFTGTAIVIFSSSFGFPFLKETKETV